MVKILHRDAISTVISIGDGVQWLMQVADKVGEVAYRFGTLHWICGLVFQDGVLFFDRTRYASFCAAVLRQISLVLAPGNVDVVPGAVFALVAHIVGPSRGIHQQVRRTIAAPAPEFWIDRIVTQKLLDHLARLRRQVFLCNQGHRLMPFATPCLGRLRREQPTQRTDCNARSESSSVANSPPVTSHELSFPCLSAEPPANRFPRFSVIANYAQCRGDGNRQNQSHASPY